MVDYQPIAELVKQIPADTWKILQEIQKRRPAMMLDELLDSGNVRPNSRLMHRPGRCRDRELAGGVDDPPARSHPQRVPRLA
jgi:hypothetical protein